MSLRLFPVKFEIVDAESLDRLVTVEAVDDNVAKVEIPKPLSAQEWREAAKLVERAMVEMAMNGAG